MDLSRHKNLVYKMEALCISNRGMDGLINGLGTLLSHLKKIRSFPHIKINSRWTNKLKVKDEPLKEPEENIGGVSIPLV